MDNIKILQPNAASIVQSMRDIGYTLNTAISDIVDNSIAANATKIDIIFHESNELKVLIIDNGTGMSANELYEAMRFAYIDPTFKRDKNDLGRFGLGLKTATFSQAKKLTVISKQDNKVSGACWDLETICQKNEWCLKLLDQEALVSVIPAEYLSMIDNQGTIVVWDDLDRLEHDCIKNISRLLTDLREHLSLVFHKFLDGKMGRKIEITVNNIPIVPFDPFLTSNVYTKHHPVEKIYSFDNSVITIQAHILPHHSKLTVDDEKVFREKSDLLNNQGFYVYRNQRLMVWGDWFKLAKKSDKYKLARVEIHFDKALDHLWEIDIKKSKAAPPPAIRQRLKEIIKKMLDDSSKVQRARISKTKQGPNVLWQRQRKEQQVCYIVNNQHPLLESFENDLTEEQKKNFRFLLDMLSKAIPYESIYGDITCDPKILEVPKDDIELAYEKFQQLLTVIQPEILNETSLLTIATNLKICIGYEHELKKWITEYYAK